MISRIDHVSLAVKNYEKAVELFTKVLGATPQTHGRDKFLNYYWHILKLGDLSRLEIIKPVAEESFLKKFLEKREGGIHHITLQTPDIEMMRKKLDNNKVPYFGLRKLGDAWKELFIHPKNAFGVLLQIAEFRADDWIAHSDKMSEGKKWSFTKNKEEYQLTFKHPGGGKVKFNMDKVEINKLIIDLKNLVQEKD